MKPAFHHITVPVDGSTTSERGVAFALELAREGGRVSFCSVVDPMLVCAPAMYGAALDPGPMLEVLDEDAALFCRRAKDEGADHGIACDAEVLHGPCTDEIYSFAQHNRSDAIVIGTHGRSGLSRAVLGSVAEGIVRRSAIPVVSVHEDDMQRTGPVAVALDSSPAAQAALDVGIGIAAARDMPSIMIFVCDDSSPRPLAVNTLLEHAAERARASGVAAKLVVREGDAADELLAAAEDEDCCMIVMGTHGRSPIARLILGSVAAEIVERAHVPVVTTHCAA
ncbi:MAG: universal stress protein [Candidatus Elarobacter sp.]